MHCGHTILYFHVEEEQGIKLIRTKYCAQEGERLFGGSAPGAFEREIQKAIDSNK